LEQQEQAMRVFVLAAVAAVGILGSSAASAVPANGIVLDQAAATAPLTQEVRWHWRGHHWRGHWHGYHWRHRHHWW
jgi:hypothetical protein